MALKTAILAAVASMALVSAAHAIPIGGSINLGGFVSATGATSFAAATGLNFQDNAASDNGGSAGTITSVGIGTGSFAGISCSASCGTIKDLTSFTMSTPLTSFVALNSNGISFDLSSVSVTDRNMSTGSITIVGTGTIHETGFDDTAGTFKLTAVGNQIVAFSGATLGATSAVAVPEPTSLAILFGSLAVTGVIRRRKA